MKSKEHNGLLNNIMKSNISRLVFICVLLYVLAIFQDYAFSKLRNTAFYWSDTMLYNIYWLLFIPFIKIASVIYSKIQPKSLLNKILYAFGSGFVFSLLHIFIFTSIFILGSNFIFPEPHRFSRIFKSAISNQSQITIITYLLIPFIIEFLNRKKQLNKQNTTQQFITVKNGTRRIKVEISTIQFIKTDRPYTTIFADNQKFLHDESLKKLENLLDPQIFIRVHRSAIINKNHISVLKSRKNGDYDGILTNGQSVRFSRHYRENWISLLNH